MPESIIVSILFLSVWFSTASGSSLDDQLRLIRGTFQDGLYDLTESEARSFLKTAGNHAAVGEVNLILGYIASRNGHDDKAVNRFQKATRSDDPSVRLQGYYELGGLNWKRRQFAEAADAYQAIVDENRSSPVTDSAQYWLPISLYHAGQFQAMTLAASKTFASNVKLTGEQILQLVFYRGKSWFELKEYHRSIDDLLTVYRSESPTFQIDAISLLAQVYLADNDLNQADLWASRRLEHGTDLQSLTIRAALALKNNDWHGALKLFRSATSIDELPEDRSEYFYYNAAVCESRILGSVNANWWSPLLEWVIKYPSSTLKLNLLDELQKISESSELPPGLIAHLEAAAQWDPETTGQKLANLALKEKDFERALYWLSRYYRYHDSDASSRFVMAQLLSAVGEKGEASQELARLGTLLTESSSDNTMQRAELYFQAGMYQKSAGLFQDILTGDTLDSSVRQRSMFRLAESYFQMQEWKLAHGVFLQYSNMFPELSSNEKEIVQRRMVMCATHLQQWSLVLELTDSFLADFPETQYSGELYYLRGLSQANQGMLDEAVKTLGLALDSMDDDTQIESIKDAIRQINIRKAEISDNS